MLRLSVLAAAALAGAHACTTNGDCAADEICRVAVAVSGAACDTMLPKVCVKRSKRGESCGGGGGAAHDCFRNECLTTQKCRPNSQDANLPGTCAKECDLGGGAGMVYEGWTGPVAGAGKWCHTRYCDGSDDTKPAGVLTDTSMDTSAACPTDLASGLRCCPGAGDAATQACCGTTGAWVTKDAADKVKCADVEVAHGAGLAAPFSKTCTGACAGPPARDDGWTGPNPAADKWCNTCVCTGGAVSCPDRACPKLKCCKGTGDACCGVTGKWVTKDAKTDEVVCGGVTLKLPLASPTPQPFHAACAADRDCIVSATPDLKIKHGETMRNPKVGQECNTCTCTDGEVVCETAACPPVQCCRDPKPAAGTTVCCGLDGLWKTVDGTAKCGASVPTQTAPGVAATGYPFAAKCMGCEADVWDGTSAYVKKVVTVGWTGPKEGGKSCDTCTCKVNGDAPVCTSVALEADCAAARCCSLAAPTPAGDYVCCGATGRWVKKGTGNAVSCGGVAFTQGQTNTDKLLGAACKADVCTLTGGEKKADGWGGRNTGADWCQLCSCDDTKPAAGKLSCTTNVCATRCCDPATKPATGTWECCGATATWVKADAAGDYSCGGVTLKTGVPLAAACPDTTTTTKCKLHDAAATEVAQGWTGTGQGDKWCHGSCKCTKALADTPTGPVACPAEVCPTKPKLMCCAKDIPTAGDVCCGLTGEWVNPTTGVCGAVDLAGAGALNTAAPFTAACPKCTLFGTTKEVPAGWKGAQPGAGWCNTCYCGMDGNMKCTKKASCPPLTCCATANPGGAVCCGATGDWAAPAGGEVTCKAVTVATAEATAHPFITVACAVTCTHNGVLVPQGWAGKMGGADTCDNYCYCDGAGVMQCSTKVCP